jgi:hypothetical protein
VTRIVAAALIATVGLTMLVSGADAHPLHTTLTQVDIAADGSIEITIRVFVDDFSAAVAGRILAAGSGIPTPTDSASARYLQQTLVLTDASGRRAPLALAAVRRTHDLLWITLKAPGMRNAAGARLTTRMLFDRWSDQVNIVQTSVGNSRRTLLFTRSDGAAPKPL